jgi:hypothetical protein
MKELPSWSKVFLANESEVILRRRDMIAYGGNLEAFYEGIHNACNHYNRTAYYDDRRKEFRFVRNPSPASTTQQTKEK